MSESAKALFAFLSALFPIVDPLGGSPIFLALTEGYSGDTRRALARRIAFDSIYLLMLSYLIGSHVLVFFGISLPVVQISGGGSWSRPRGWTMLKQPDGRPYLGSDGDDRRHPLVHLPAALRRRPDHVERNQRAIGLHPGRALRPRNACRLSASTG